MRDFDAVIVNFMREQGIPGASLCIAKGGHVIYTQSTCSRPCRSDEKVTRNALSVLAIKYISDFSVKSDVKKLQV